MEKPIKITKSLKFNFYDLMRDVDTEHEFTLRDVLNACMKSKIPLEILQAMLRCNYIEQYWKEMKSKKFKNDGDGIEYLELAWNGTIDEYKGKQDSSSSWHFNGVGKKGYIPDDLLGFCSKKEIAKMKKEGYRQSYAIEFRPMYALANFPIKIRKEIKIEDWRNYKKKLKKKEDIFTIIDVQPSITLMELLYWIFWELSFCGSPEKRDGISADLDERVKELDKAKKEGRLDEITVPWEEVKKNLKKKVKELQ